jgi:Rieske Fe-S protein
MTERRRFLQVIGGTALGFSALETACGTHANSTATTTSSGAGGGGGGGSGAGGGGEGGGMPGTGGASSSSSSASASSSSGAACEMTPAGVKLGKPSSYAATGLHIVTNSGVLIGRDANGLYALTAVCTHQQCDMSAVDAGGPYGQLAAGGKDITCLCHGSEFSATGVVVRGPAYNPLRAYPLALGCDGYLYVDKTKHVATTVRLKA